MKYMQNIFQGSTPPTSYITSRRMDEGSFCWQAGSGRNAARAPTYSPQIQQTSQDKETQPLQLSGEKKCL